MSEPPADTPATDTAAHHGRGLARDAATNLAARLFAMACSSVTALVIANALTKGQYGAYSVVLGINVVLVMALDLGMTSALSRYVAQGKANTRLVATVALVRFAVMGVAALVVLASPFAPGIGDGKVVTLLPMLAVLIVGQGLLTFHFGALPSLRRIRLLLFVTVAQPAGELALVLLVRAREGGAGDMLLATAGSGLVVSLLAWVLLLAPGRAAAPEVTDAGAGSLATLAMVAKYGRSIFLVSLLIAVFGQVDQFVIGAFRPLAEVAPYALAIKVQALVAAPAITIAGIVAPRIAGAGPGALGLYRQWLGFLVVFNLGAVLTIGVLAPQTFGAIGGQYRGEWPLLVAMLPFTLLSSVAPLPSITLNQTGHASSRLAIAAVTVALDVGIDLALVPWLGAYGAAIATTVAFGYYLLRHHALLDRALAVDASPGTAHLSGVLVRGTLVAVAVAALAGLVRLGLEAALDDPSDLLVLLVAGGLAAAAHTGWCARLLRHPTPARS
ncbi:MAG: flippase [Thermoleophilia bacterium]|nr:flippase [Thermoleophilia bacterium]